MASRRRPVSNGVLAVRKKDEDLEQPQGARVRRDLGLAKSQKVCPITRVCGGKRLGVAGHVSTSRLMYIT